MTVSKEQAQAALNWFNKETNHNTKMQEVQTIRTVLKERLDCIGSVNNEVQEADPSTGKEEVQLDTIGRTGGSNPPTSAMNSEALATFRGAYNGWRTFDDQDKAQKVYQLSQQDAELIETALQRNDVPHGFVLVPIEPTEEMYEAAFERDKLMGYPPISHPRYVEAYKTMIAAAPKAGE